MAEYDPVKLESYVRERAPEIARDIRAAAKKALKEVDLVAEVEKILDKFSQNFDIQLHLDRERTLVNGRADAVYNRFVIEYEPPNSLQKSNNYRNNKHAIEQVQNYMGGLERLDRHRKERLAGVVLDGGYFIFARYREDHWNIDDPLPVDTHSTETFLRYLLSLSTELALTPENLVRDFGENSNTARRVVPALYASICTTTNKKAGVLFQQWQRQFREVSGYDPESGQLNPAELGRLYAVTGKAIDLEKLFFAIHTYYATFIKLLALQVAYYYLMPKMGSGLAAAANQPSDKLCTYLQDMERGGLFRQLGICNFLEGDFFGWYLDIWDESLDVALRRLIGDLANYSLVTLDVDPEETRDLLKQLYQNLMPRELRHSLGEYYTPDWLADRLLNQLGYQGDPHIRLLDPACGSGTFLVLAIKRVRAYADEKMLPPAQVLNQILENLVGFDLNPLAVISSRTNYLLALGDLLSQRKGDVSIPIYLADSILTPSEGTDLFTQNIFTFNTSVGRFSIPKSLVKAHYIDKLADLLEECVHINLAPDLFRKRLLQTFSFKEPYDEEEIGITMGLYKQLLQLEEQGNNGIWARIIKNAFAPLFQAKFDFVAGNPPWINWANLPSEYRRETAPFWQEYHLFSHIGLKARMGGAMDDLSVLMFYVAIDKYLLRKGKLGFVITQSIFKTEGGGKGFRQFRLGNKQDKLKVLHVDDMVAIQPFEGASNRSSVIIVEKGSQTLYPVNYTIWLKKGKRTSIKEDMSLDEVISETKRLKWLALPVDPKDDCSPWITGRSRAIAHISKLIGESGYQARLGVHCWLVGVYWIEVLKKLPNNLVLISNLTENVKKDVDNIQAVIEADLIHPLIRGRDIDRWHAESSAYFLIPQDPNRPDKGFPEKRLSTRYPKTYSYLTHFHEALSARSGYIKFLEPQGEPFYALYDIGIYTFAPYKVVWMRISNTIKAAVSSNTFPDNGVTFVSFENKTEAHYFCSMLNSSIFSFAVSSFSVAGTGTWGSPHILRHIKIPSFDSNNRTHLGLATLSKKAHKIVSEGDLVNITNIETKIDHLAAQLWGLTEEELKDIQESLQELH